VLAVRTGRTAGTEHADTGLKLQRSFNAVCLGVDPGEHQRVGAQVGHQSLLRRVKAGRKGDPPRSIRRDAHDDHLVRGAGENLARKLHAAGGVSNSRDGGVEVQVTAIIRYAFHPIKIQQEISHGLVGHLAAWNGNHLLVHQPVRLAVFALKNQAPRLRQRPERFRIILVIRTAAPQRIFIKLQPLLIDTAEYHRPQTPAANGERFDPLPRGPAIPQTERFLGR